MGVAAFLDDLCDDLAGCGINSHQLAALEFAADGHDINVRSCKDRGGVHYPDLWTIAADIGRTLDAQEVSVGQLRRMIFLDAEISVELVDADGRISARSWPLTRFGARMGAAVGPVTWTIMDEADSSEPVFGLGSMELQVRRA